VDSQRGFLVVCHVEGARGRAAVFWGKGRLQGVNPGAAVAWSSGDLTFPAAWCSVGLLERVSTVRDSREGVNCELQSRQNENCGHCLGPAVLLDASSGLLVDVHF
jgi:hypothetical protein